VLARIGNALVIPAVRSNARLVETLERLRTRVESCQTGVREAENSNATEVIKAAELKLYDEAVKISLDLDDLEKRHPVLTQCGTAWTTPDGKLEAKYQKTARGTFYRFGYRQHTGRLLTDAHDEKRRRVAQFGTNPMYPKASYSCPGFGTDPAHLAYDRFGVQPDHREPVTSHWERQGRRTTQIDREQWDTDITSLIAMWPRRGPLPQPEEGLRRRALQPADRAGIRRAAVT
jgi:hypothetical protein